MICMQLQLIELLERVWWGNGPRGIFGSCREDWVLFIGQLRMLWVLSGSFTKS